MRDLRGSVLARIVDRTQRDLEARRGPLSALPAAPPVRDFLGALRRPGLSLIAEIKPRSPSRGALRPEASAAELAALYQRHAGCMSVLCDGPFFGGGYALLSAARAACELPLLAKDFVVDAYQIHEARAHGGDAVLLMASVLEAQELEALLAVARGLGVVALVETHDAAEVGLALELGARLVGVNSRDLSTLRVDLPRAARLLARVPPDRVRVAESGLDTVEAVDRVRPLADAALIGGALMSARDPARRMTELGWPAG